MEILVELYECDNCYTIFGIEKGTNVECCPSCGEQNPRETGGGIIKNIFEH